MAINKTFEIRLDMKKAVSNQPITVVQGDNGNVFVVTLTDNGVAVDVTGCRVLAVFSKPDGNTVEQDTDGHGITVGGDAGNEITIALYSGSFTVGTTHCELQIYSGSEYGTIVTSAKFNFECRSAIMNDETIQATVEYPVLAKLIQDCGTLKNDVQPDWSETDDTKHSYVRNKPTSFAPLAHAETHETGGNDPVTPIAHADRHASGGLDPVTPAAIGAVVKATATTTLSTANWAASGDAYTQTVSVAGVTANNDAIVSPAAASRTAYNEAGCWCSAQGAGTLTFTAESVPAAALSVAILILT